MTTNYHTAIATGAAANAATFNTPLGALDEAITNAQSGMYNVLEYGATGDGTTDDATAIQAAITACRAVGGGVVLFPEGTYAIASTLTVAHGGVGVRIEGRGSGMPFTTPTLLWTGATSASAVMLLVESHSHGISISGLCFDGDKKAGICIHLEGIDGENIHRPHLERLWFQGYSSRGLVIGANSTTVACNAQMQIATFNELTFYGGAVGAIAILLNAENCEWASFNNLYIDPYPDHEHLYHIFAFRGGLHVDGMVTTRATDYAIVGFQQVGIYNWRAEDRYLISLEAVDPAGPSVIMNLEQRYDPTAAPLYNDWTIKIYHTGQAVTLSSILLQGSIVIGPTDQRYVVATGIVFAQGGDFYPQTSTAGMLENAQTGNLQLLGVETLTADATNKYAAGLSLAPRYTAATAKTATNHNYISALQPLLQGDGPAAVTHAPLVYFNAAAGTHKALDAASTKTTPTAVDGWLKVNVNDTLYYIPMYTSKTE